MAEGDQDHRRIAKAVAVFAGRSAQLLDLGFGQVFPRS
jgi:hypothetical protein